MKTALPRWLPAGSRAAVQDLGKRVAGDVGAGLNALLGARVPFPLSILVYHRVAPRLSHVPAPPLNVTPGRFRRQIAGLLARGFRFWSLERALDCCRQGGTVAPRAVVLTFDDGYASVFHYAWPILRNFGVPATIFLATAFVGSSDPFPFDLWGQKHKGRVPTEAYLPLALPQCRAMRRQGFVAFGAHTHTHQDFRNRSQDFRRDLQTSVDLVKSWFDLQEVPFAFPYGRRCLGYVSEDLIAAAREAGVCCGLSTECQPVGSRADPFQWGRYNVYDWDDAATLGAKLAGWYCWAVKLQERFFRVT
jgi:peptidoglycan/xylan/chitin deacetylase (PgdA/CDA1 family)